MTEKKLTGVERAVEANKRFTAFQAEISKELEVDFVLRLDIRPSGIRPAAVWVEHPVQTPVETSKPKEVPAEVLEETLAEDKPAEEKKP